MSRSILGKYEFAIPVLGGRATLGAALDSHAGFIDLLFRGLPVQALDHICRYFEPARGHDEVVRRAIGVDLHSARRGTLSPEESASALEFAQTFGMAMAVFGSSQEAASWFSRPEIALDGQTPLQAFADESSRKNVGVVLHRIEHGVYT